MMFILWFLLNVLMVGNAKEYIIDSEMTFEEAIMGSKAPKGIIDSLILLDVFYYSFDNQLHKGQLLVNKLVAKDIQEIFEIILESKFPIAKVIPIVKYNWSDSISMEDNNTSAFNYRFVAGTNRLSMHSFGRAIDINPFFNPVVYKDGRTEPRRAVYDTSKLGTFTEDNFIVKEFQKRGWRWGGHFSSYKDFHHFDKP
ncbi:MAG: M15 family metallopeptidase [Candidatus Kapaibacteriales bacterium]